MSLAGVGLVVAYIVVAVLLLSLNLTSLWRWWVKAAAIVVTIAFFAVSYSSLQAMMGWPTFQKPPARFSLVWTMVSEPDKKTRNPGAIYLWADALDANNVPAGRPRSYQLPYSDALARRVAAAQEKREHGQDVMGTVSVSKPPPDAKPLSDIKMGQIQDDKKGDHNAAADTVPFMDDGTRLGFEDLPPVLLPNKGPI